MAVLLVGATAVQTVVTSAANWAAMTAEKSVARWAYLMAVQLAEQKVASRAVLKAAQMVALSVDLLVATKAGMTDAHSGKQLADWMVEQTAASLVADLAAEMVVK